MKPKIRQELILGRLRAARQAWRVETLAQALRVSPLTIRRDLDRLAEAGAIIRTHGGCLAAGAMENLAFQRRVAANFELKRAIGRAAAGTIGPGQAVIINDGSTAFHLASCLGGRGRISVYTNSVAMISELSRFRDVRLFLLGGEYHRDLMYLGGVVTERVLETIAADIVFLGTDAIDRAGRCLVADHNVARTAQMMLRSGRRKILLADTSKIGAAGMVVYAALSDFDLWITAGNSAGLRPLRRHTTIKEAKA